MSALSFALHVLVRIVVGGIGFALLYWGLLGCAPSKPAETIKAPRPCCGRKLF